jgi:hypothetical protein
MKRLNVFLILAGFLNTFLVHYSDSRTEVLPTGNKSNYNCSRVGKDILKYSDLTWEYYNFNNFQDINVQQDLACIKKRPSRLIFFPSQELVVNETLDLSVLYRETDGLVIHIFKIKGFQLMSKPFLKVYPRLSTDILFHFVRSSFNFYLNGTNGLEEIKSKDCDLGKIDYQSINFFNNLGAAFLIYETSTKYESAICPFIFNNANIKQLTFSGLQDTRSFLVQRSLSFIEIESDQIDLNTSIFMVQFSKIYRRKLDSSILNVHVFKNTFSFTFDGTLDFIEKDLFKSFLTLGNLFFNLFNTREFLHSSVNKWMAFVYMQGMQFDNRSEMENSNITISNAMIIQFRDYDDTYEYPDEDFCLFKYWPDLVFIVPFLYGYKADYTYVEKKSDSCTLAFLSKYNDIYNFKFGDIFNSNWFGLLRTLDPDFIERCDLKTRLATCFAKPDDFIPEPTKNDFNYYDLTFVFQWLDFLGPITSFSLVAVLGFVLNLLIILILTDKRNIKNKMFEQKLYRYILVNSVFNCIECFLSIFKLVNECMGLNSIFCSSVQYTLVAQFFKACVTGYLSEFMKTCSILTNLTFSVERYIETSKTKRKMLTTFTKSSLRSIVICVVFTGAFLSLTKPFEYDIKDLAMYSYDTPSPFRHAFSESKTWEKALYFTHYILNDFVILVINLIVDICLVREIKRDVTKKQEFRHKEEVLNNFVKTPSHSETSTDIKKLESKANAMIVMTLVVYLFCRLPELGSTFFFVYFSMYLNYYKVYCFNVNFCYLLSNTIDYLYMVSYSTNIFFYYKFNKNFKRGFKAFFKR